MSCDEAPRVHAYFDGELDANAAAELEMHLEGCTDCAALLKDLEATRGALRAGAPYHRANTELRERIDDMLSEADGGHEVRHLVPARSSFVAGMISGGCVTALAAVLAFFLFLPPPPNSLVGDLTNAHLRSLMSDRLIDVASSDRHTVKPWFARHTDISPPTFDFTTQGYSLIGGRADYVDGRRAAVVVYRHGKHVINVFAWNGDGRMPDGATRNGYHLLFWRSSNIDFCAISDAAPEEISGLVRLIEQSSPPRE